MIMVNNQDSGIRLLKKLYGLYIRSINIRLSVPNEFNFDYMDTHLLKYHGRSIGNDIYDLPTVFTGSESLKSRHNSIHNKLYKPCKEHLWPRQWAGEYLTSFIIKSDEVPEFKEIIQLVYKFCHVHHVTSAENMLLRPFQKISTFKDPQFSYLSCGVVLTPAQSTKIPNSWQFVLNYLNIKPIIDYDL